MIRLALAFALACSCSPVLAQKMYRCGNQFQERPCAGPKIEAVAPAAKADPQQQEVARRHEHEQEIRRSRCANYAEELADVDRRIAAGADKDVIDQFRRRQKEMRSRIERSCK